MAMAATPGLRTVLTTVVVLWFSGVTVFSQARDGPPDTGLTAANISAAPTNNITDTGGDIYVAKGKNIVSSNKLRDTKSDKTEKNNSYPIEVTGHSDNADTMPTNTSKKGSIARAAPLINITANAATSSFLRNLTVQASSIPSTTGHSLHINNYQNGKERDKEDHSDINTDTETATPEFTTSVKLDSNIEESLGQISNETDSVDMSDSLTRSQSNDDKSEVVTHVSEPGPVTMDTKIHQGDNGTKQGAEVPGASPAGSHRQHGGHRGQAGHNTHRQIPFRHHLQLVPMEDEPFGAVILKDERYVVSVMIPIGVGVIGAAIIIATLYTLRYIARKNAGDLRFPGVENGRPHPPCISSISSQQTDRTDRVVLLGGDEDDDF